MPRKRKNTAWLSTPTRRVPLIDENICNITVFSRTTSDDADPYRNTSLFYPPSFSSNSISPLPVRRKPRKVCPWSIEYLLFLQSSSTTLHGRETQQAHYIRKKLAPCWSIHVLVLKMTPVLHCHQRFTKHQPSSTLWLILELLAVFSC